MSKTTLALPFALALVVSALACAPEVIPSPVTYKDVQPLLAAHCVRCHNETLTGGIDPKTGMAAKPPGLCHLNRFENTGDCSTAGVMMGLCLYGAGDPSCAGRFPILLSPETDDLTRMPKPPSDRLNSWEHDVLTRWAAAPTN